MEHPKDTERTIRPEDVQTAIDALKESYPHDHRKFKPWKLPALAHWKDTPQEYVVIGFGWPLPGEGAATQRRIVFPVGEPDRPLNVQESQITLQKKDERTAAHGARHETRREIASVLGDASLSTDTQVNAQPLVWTPSGLEHEHASARGFMPLNKAVPAAWNGREVAILGLGPLLDSDDDGAVRLVLCDPARPDTQWNVLKEYVAIRKPEDAGILSLQPWPSEQEFDRNAKTMLEKYGERMTPAQRMEAMENTEAVTENLNGALGRLLTMLHGTEAGGRQKAIWGFRALAPHIHFLLPRIRGILKHNDPRDAGFRATCGKLLEKTLEFLELDPESATAAERRTYVTLFRAHDLEAAAGRAVLDTDLSGMDFDDWNG